MPIPPLMKKSSNSWHSWHPADKRKLLKQLQARAGDAAYMLGNERARPGGGYVHQDAELPWQDWLKRRFPHVTSSPFAKRHLRLWNWYDDLTPGVRPPTQVEVWPRGGAKSSTAELGVVWVGLKLTRRFVLYVSATQEQANDHVQTIGSLFESMGVGRAINKYGNSKGWKVNVLRTENGFNVVALGLDAAARGVKLDHFRPDLLILDDIDAEHDSELVRDKKINAITLKLLPAGSTDLAVLVVQNLIYKDGIVAMLADGRAEFLMNRVVPPVEPAVYDLQFERVEQPDGSCRFKITGGTPSWEGQSLSICEAQLNDWGRRAFLREAQQRVNDAVGGLWIKERDIDPFRVTVAPTLTDVIVAIDPSATSNGDEAGIIVAGIAWEYKGTKTPVPHAYILSDMSIGGSPKRWAEQAVTGARQFHAPQIVAESNNGGEMVEITIQTIPFAPKVELIHATDDKITRAEPIQKLYEDGLVHHVGHFQKLEHEMCSWKPGDPSPNRLDAMVWAVTRILLQYRAENTIQRPKAMPAGRRYV